MFPNALKVSHGFITYDMNALLQHMITETKQQSYYVRVALDLLSGTEETNTVEQTTERIYRR